MKNIYFYPCLVLSTLNLTLSSLNARAADFALSPDGSAVVRLNPIGSASASSLDTSLFPAGWTIANTGTNGLLGTYDYNAGFTNLRGTDIGGGTIKALFTNNVTQAPSQYAEWVQVVTSNDIPPCATSPCLDNQFRDTTPFYSYTVQNLSSTNPPNSINFFDFSARDPSNLSSINPIIWNASLYPVVGNPAQQLTVYDGVTWGWTMKPATVGLTAGSFTNPSPSSAVNTGVGTSAFTWGSGDPSALIFSGSTFDTKPNTTFKLGTLTFHNGAIFAGTGADSVNFNASLKFNNIPEKNFTLSSLFTLINTTNTSDPIASADQVSLGDWGYNFNVLEGSTASVDILANLTTNLNGAVDGTEGNAALISDANYAISPDYILTIVGVANPTSGGFVTATSVPEPSGGCYIVAAAGSIVLLKRVMRQRKLTLIAKD
jgi:hypothetical protein